MRAVRRCLPLLLAVALLGCYQPPPVTSDAVAVNPTAPYVEALRDVQIAYDTILAKAGGAHLDGTISDEEFARVLDVGTIVQTAGNAAQRALSVYLRLSAGAAPAGRSAAMLELVRAVAEAERELATLTTAWEALNG